MKCTSYHPGLLSSLCSLPARWDKENSKYKIMEPVGEDKALDDLDQYVFVARKQLGRNTISMSLTLDN